MLEIRSKITGEITHVIQKRDEITEPRIDLSDEKEFLQASAHKLDQKVFRPHRHIWKDVSHSTMRVQEAWIVISGSTKFTAYDEDGTFMSYHYLFPGDCVISFGGGHTYEILEDGSLVYEFKTGPYEGIEKDKEWL